MFREKENDKFIRKLTKQKQNTYFINECVYIKKKNDIFNWCSILNQLLFNWLLIIFIKNEKEEKKHLSKKTSIFFSFAFFLLW